MAEGINTLISHLKKKVGKKMGGGDDLMLAQLILGFCRTALCHPRISQFPELVKGRGTKEFPPVWKSSAMPESFSRHSTSRVQEGGTQNCSDQYGWELLPCPQFNWTPSTAGICTGAQISVGSHPLMFSVQNLFVFMCSQMLHFNAAYWLFHYFIFLSWSEGVFVDFMFYYYLVLGRTSEIKWLEKCVRFWWLLNTTSLAPAKNGSIS